MKYILLFIPYLFALSVLAAEIPSNHPSVKGVLQNNDAVSNESSSSLPNTGTVVSTIHIKNYTYIEIKQDEGNIWLAAPKIDLVNDTQIRYGKGITMVNFYSNGLKREFPEILFVDRVENAK